MKKQTETLTNRFRRRFRVRSVCLMLAIGSSASSPVSASQAGAAPTYHFDWAITGSSAVAPRQVFDDGTQVYLQFASDADPAVFADTPGGPILLQPMRQSIYLVIPHMETRLAFQVGAQRATARRSRSDIPPEGALGNQAAPIAFGSTASPVHVAGSAQTPATYTQLQLRRDVADALSRPEPPASAPPLAAAQTSLSQALLESRGSEVAASYAVSSVASSHVSTADQIHDGGPAGETHSSSSQSVATAGLAEAASPSQLAPAPAPSWRVTPADGTLRQALATWALAAGWTFEPEHWAVHIDIPITAEAAFTGEFRDVARELIATTELTDTPLQACVYSNRVVRVIGYTAMCDRTTM